MAEMTGEELVAVVLRQLPRELVYGKSVAALNDLARRLRSANERAAAAEAEVARVTAERDKAEEALLFLMRTANLCATPDAWLKTNGVFGAISAARTRQDSKKEQAQ